MGNIDQFMNIKGVWDKDSMPLFMARTKTNFSSLPIKSVLEDRGLSNRLLDSLLYELPDGAFIGGGFLTTILREEKDANDIDFFFTSQESFKETFKLLIDINKEGVDYGYDEEAWAYKGYKLEDEKLLDSVNAYYDPNDILSFSPLDNVRFVKFVHPKRPPIQLIKLAWYESPEHVIDTFDFTVVQFICDRENLYFNPVSFLDLARKRLVLHRMQFPASTLRRLIKYTHKGFYCCPGSLITISEAINSTLNNPYYVSENNQIVYVD